MKIYSKKPFQTRSIGGQLQTKKLDSTIVLSTFEIEPLLTEHRDFLVVSSSIRVVKPEVRRSTEKKYSGFRSVDWRNPKSKEETFYPYYIRGRSTPTTLLMYLIYVHFHSYRELGVTQEFFPNRITISTLRLEVEN